MIFTTILALVAPFAAYHLSQIIYNLFFHPLRHFPGPRLAAATWWYTTYYEVFRDGAFLGQLGRLHEQYGPVVRVAPNELHFKGLQYHRDIYVNGSRFLKDPRLYSTFHEDESSFCFIDPQEAKIRRDMISPLFSRRAIIKLESYIQATVDKFIGRLLQESPKPIDVHRAYRCTTLEIILSYCFARNFDILSAPEFRDPLILAVEVIMPLALVFKHFPFVYGVLLGLDGVFKRLRKDSFGPGELMNSLSQQIDELLEQPELLRQQTHDTIYHHLLTPNPAKGQPTVPSKKSLLEEAMNLVAAGSDTVGNTCTVGTFYVLNNPSVLSALRKELRTAWPDVTIPVGYETLEKLPYLTAVIKESLRMSHGIATPLPRIVAPVDSAIGGVVVPVGAVVGMGATFVHHDPELFPDPHNFLPDRWLCEGSCASDSHIVAFSKGPRMCLGINLAWCELYLLFANVFRKLDLQLHDTRIEDLKFQCHLTPTFRKHVKVVVAKADK